MSSRIIAKAKALGASLAGVARVDRLKVSPSHVLAPTMAPNTGVGARESDKGLKPGEVAWPAKAESAVVIAVAHPEDRPELDWWYGQKAPLGNRILMDINRELAPWVEQTLGIVAYPLPYHIERGGIFLKDAAVLAGLGCIGRNNILITPEYGPRIRLRAMLLEEKLDPTGPIDFDPCRDCGAPCRKACPQVAFGMQMFQPMDTGTTRLPGRDGMFSRAACNIQMQSDVSDASGTRIDAQSGGTVPVIKYCRQCESACPVGR